jgi:hypothetical protein
MPRSLLDAWRALPAWGQAVAGFAGLAGGLVLLRPAEANALAAGPPRGLSYAGATPFPSTTTDPHGHFTPSGREVAITRAPLFAGGQDFACYVVPAAMRLGGLSREAAILFAAHLSRETGAGHSVWCNDFGNIKAKGRWRGDWYRLGPHGDAYEPFRAYASPDAGLSAALGLIAHAALYREAWALLTRGDPAWYAALGRAGYYQSDPEASEREYVEHFLPAVRAWAAACPAAASGALGRVATPPPRRRVPGCLSLSEVRR